jgi:hypothetical protein
MWFVFEAEYEIENGRANWNRPIASTMMWHGPFANGNRPIASTMMWHGPFANGAAADEVAKARMWSKIDIYAHKARAIDMTVAA